MTAYVLATSDGQITQYGAMSDEDWPAFNPVGLQKIEIPAMPAVEIRKFILAHCVLDGQVMRRRPMECGANTITIKADGQDLLTITGLPQPCTVVVSGVRQAGPLTVEDGELLLTADAPGQFHVQVDAGLEWIPWEAVFNAT